MENGFEGQRFSLLQCQFLVKLKYLGMENNPSQYKELQNQLVRLKYLFEEKSPK
jgi:hypothetical protein